MGKRFGGPAIRTALAVLIVLGILSGMATADAAATDFDLTGVWKYETGKYWNKGACPPGRSSRGDCRITQDGDDITLVFTKGMACNPESMCTFTGKITGNRCELSNSAQVDNEGGVAKNRLVLVMESKDRGSGESKSEYNHPSGFQCQWGTTVTVSR